MTLTKLAAAAAVAVGWAVAGGADPGPDRSTRPVVRRAPVPAVPRPGQLLVSRDGKLVRYNPDGTGEEVVAEDYEAAAASPDGRWLALAYHRVDGRRVTEQVVLRPLGREGDDVQVSREQDEPINTKFAWAPDSRRLLVTYTRHLGDGEWRYTHRLFDPATREQTPVEVPDRVVATDWAADGKRLLVLGGRGDPKRPTVRLAWMPADGRGPLEYPTPAGQFYTNGRASPDGRWVACWTRPMEGRDRDSGSDFVVLSLRDGTVTRLVDGTKTWVHSSAWSPDGNRLAFSSMPRYDNPKEVTEAVTSLTVCGPTGADPAVVLTHRRTGKDAARSGIGLSLLGWR